MAIESFSVNRFKWLYRNFMYVLGYLLLAVFCWVIFNYEHMIYMLGLAVVFFLVAVAMLFVAFLGSSKLTVDEQGNLKFGKARFNFGDVVDVHRKKDVYTFMLATRRRVIVDLAPFSDADKNKIDKLFARECLERMATPEARGKIAAVRENSQLEFTVEARRTAVFYTFYIIGLVYLGLAAVIVLIVLLTGGYQTITGPLLAVVGCVAIILLLRRIEKKRPKAVFSYKDDIFTMSCGGKTLFTFARGQVAGVGVTPQMKPLIVFRLQGQSKKITVSLSQFTRKDRLFLKDTVRSIFFLPESGSPGTGVPKPFGF